MSELTKAAMKAAHSLRHAIRTQQFRTEAESNRMDAAIIDRATGLPELVAALQAVLLCGNSAGKCGHCTATIKHALRKAGEDV